MPYEIQYKMFSIKHIEYTMIKFVDGLGYLDNLMMRGAWQWM